jgi:hypothetical protein
MGTRSVIYFQERRKNGRIVIYAVVYQQYDGYLSGVGKELATFLKAVKFIELMVGLVVEPENVDMIICNGFGDLVARFIQKFKKDAPYKFYVSSATLDQDQEYSYYVVNTDEGIRVKVCGISEDEVPAEMREDTRTTIEMSVDDFVKISCSGGECIQS